MAQRRPTHRKICDRGMDGQRLEKGSGRPGNRSPEDRPLCSRKHEPDTAEHSLQFARSAYSRISGLFRQVVIGKDFGYRIDTLLRVSPHGRGKDTAVDDKEALRSPNMEILTDDAVLCACSHLIRPLHVG